MFQESREKMVHHLAFVKWSCSAFSTEQLRTTRWLLGAKPKGFPDALNGVLTVTPLAQSMLIELHIKSFQHDTRRLKVSAWCRKRASPEEFDKLVDYACVFASLRTEAKKVNSDAEVDNKLMTAFLAKDYFQDIEALVASKNPQFRLESLSVWMDLIAPPALPTCLQADANVDALAAQEQAAQSKFAEVKIRLAADCQAMHSYNQEVEKSAGKLHVAKVLHEKTQLEKGKQPLN
eukprot:Skav224253  [mRNA]  locus=scaffold2636:43241:44084:+ [translate_table: standard]